MIHGLHEAFLVLGAMTVLSTLIFAELEPGDGDNVKPAPGYAARRMEMNCPGLRADGCWTS